MLSSGIESKVNVSIRSTDLTADWQTYRNEEFGFEVRYPRDWLVEENSTVLFLSKNDVTSRSNPDPHFHTFSMDISIHNTNDTLEEFLKKRFNLKSLDEFKITPDESNYNIDWLKVTILGNDIQAHFIHEWVQAFSVCHFFVEHNDVIIEITRDGRYNCLDDPQFDQILSAFRSLQKEGNNEQLLGDAAIKEECLVKGGVWQKWGLAQLEYCQIPAKDAGKSCTDQSQCAYGCISETGSIPGKCATYKNTFGCFSLVDNGKAEQALCVD